MEEIAIDPSGTGISCLYYPNDKLKDFIIIKHTDWRYHFSNIIKNIKINSIVYLETVKSAYNNQNKDLVPLIKLCGAIEIFCLTNNIKLVLVTSDQTKRYVRWFKDYIPPEESHYKKNIKKKEFINKTNMKFEKNKFYYKSEKLLTHQRDSIIIYHIGMENEKNA